MLKTENKHTLNYCSVCSKTNNFLRYLCSPALTACFQCLLLRGQGSKQKCPVRAAFKYQYQEISPFRFAHPFHFALPSPIDYDRPVIKTCFGCLVIIFKNHYFNYYYLKHIC
jgi:hypothetical protein